MNKGIRRSLRFASIGSLAVAASVSIFLSASSTPAVATTRAPVTIVIGLSDNATVLGTRAVFDALASSGASTIRYQLTGEGLSSQVIATATPTIYGWLALWDSTTVPNGTYTLQSVASFPGTVSVTSSAVTINVTNQAPSTAVISPVAGTTLSSYNELVFDALASPGVTQVQFELSSYGEVQETFTATPTIYGWIATDPPEQPVPNGGPVAVPTSVQATATYSGGVAGVSTPIAFTLDVYLEFT